MRRRSLLALCALPAVVLSACGGSTQSGGSSANPTTSATSLASTAASSTPPPTTLSSAAPTTLADYVLPAPDGYDLSTSSDVTNGPIDTAAFDKQLGSGTSARRGFVAGYSDTYDSTASDDSVEDDLFRFHTAAQASAFAVLVESEAPQQDQGNADVRAAVAGVPGAVGFFSTKVASGGADYTVIGTAGAVAFIVSFTTDNVSATYRTTVSGDAVAQYRKVSALPAG